LEAIEMLTVDRVYSELDDEWEIDAIAGSYKSRVHEGRNDQRLVFDESFRDGSVSATVTILKSSRRQDGSEQRDGALIFRYQDTNNYYFAGIGGFGTRFFIAKRSNGQSQQLVSTGTWKSINLGSPFTIQVRCSGNRIALLHNGVNQLTVLDDTFNSGPWGLFAFRTEVEFREIKVDRVKPTCFVMMPFAAEFDEVYQVISETVKKHDFECVRADARYLSGPIVDDLTDQIQRADVIVADFTGNNPNVLYEAGYAAALRKPVIQIAQSIGDLPFDVRHLRTFRYTTKILGDRRLAHDLSEAIRATTGFSASVVVPSEPASV
jgi:hypothetical protein